MAVLGSGFGNLGNQVCIIFGLENGIFKPVFCFQRNLDLILVLLTSQELQSAEKSSKPDFEADVYLGSNPRKFLGFKPRISNPRSATYGLH